MSAAHVFGDDIDTDALAPGRYMAQPLEVLAGHCLESVDPDFAGAVQPGDIVVAGRNFGIGSSREQAAEALKQLGIGAVIANSFGGIFYRNALNVGLPVFRCENEKAPARPGDALDLDIVSGLLINHTAGARVQLEPLPDFLLRIVQDGGLVEHLEKRFANKSKGGETAE